MFHIEKELYIIGMNESKRYNRILQVIDDHLIPDEEAKKRRGEVFTPPDLVREMLFGLRKDKLQIGKSEIFGIDNEGNFIDESEDNRVGGLPNEVWYNPNLKWLDPANGIGNFPVIAFYKLDYELSKVKGFEEKDTRRKHIIENMLFMIELDKGNCTTCRQIFRKIYPEAKPNICCADTLRTTFKEISDIFKVNNFDVIIGNPPFNPPKTETGSSGNSIWQNFVIKSFYMLNDGGYLIFVHPPGWKKPTEEVFKIEKFALGDYTGQIRQGQVWQVLKEEGVYKFIYTNDQRSKSLEYLDYFPAVDYYVYQKGEKTSRCDTKNIFLGNLEKGLNVKLNYDLNYLPNLITKQTQDILHKITSKDGEKTHFAADRKLVFGKTLFAYEKKGYHKYIYSANKKGPIYAYSPNKLDNIDENKVILNFGGGIDAYFVKYIKSNEKTGSAHMTLYYTVDSDKHGKNIESFFKSDLVKFIFLITQYASGKMTKNEPLVANSIAIPPEDITDYYKFFDIEEHKKYIEDLLSQYEKFKAPKNVSKTSKAKKGGHFFRTTRKKSKIN